VRTAKTREGAELIRREVAFLKALTHPLVLQLSKSRACKSSIVSAYAGQGSLADHLTAESGWRRPNRIAKVVTGIALAMRFAHSRDVTHCDLKPENVLLDWNWSVRIAGFRGSPSPDAPLLMASIPSRYLAPEGTFAQASEVFAFGLILFEILTGKPEFPTDLHPCKIALKVIEGDRPHVPDSVLPVARELIADCWAPEPDDRPTFVEIVNRLQEMEFKVTANVNSAKLAEFVGKI
jgi:serine/threonine protein kinase